MDLGRLWRTAPYPTNYSGVYGNGEARDALFLIRENGTGLLRESGGVGGTNGEAFWTHDFYLLRYWLRCADPVGHIRSGLCKQTADLYMNGQFVRLGLGQLIIGPARPRIGDESGGGSITASRLAC